MRSLALPLAVATLAAAAGAQTISRASAPAIAKSVIFEFTSAPTTGYWMLGAPLPAGSTTIPFINGTLFLNTAVLITVFQSVVPASGTDVVTLPLPPDPALAGIVLDFQAVELSPAAVLSFSTNYVELTTTVGLGTIPMFDGPSAASTTGTLDDFTVTNATAAAPAAGPLATGVTQVIYHHGYLGYTEWSPSNQTNSSSELTDHQVNTYRAVTRDARDPQIPAMQLPNGFDLYVMRDAGNRSTFFLAVLDRTTGVMHELTGSRVTDSSASSTPTSNYRPAFAFTKDGSVAAAIVHDTTNSPTPNVGPPDRIFLIHTDPAATWSNGMNAMDISGAGAHAMHTFYNGTLRFANEVVFVEGEDPGGVNGEAELLWAPSDGTGTLQILAVPNTGTGQPFYWSRSDWRVSDDGKTMVCPYSAFAGGSSDAESDILAIRNIGKAGPNTPVNVTAFSAATMIRDFGISSMGATANVNNPNHTSQFPNKLGALSPSGSRVAFTTGDHDVTMPAEIYVAPTDGSGAGSLAPITAGKFDAQVTQFCELNWLDDNRLLFVAMGAPTPTSSAPPGGDYYLYDSGTGTISNLTQTTTGSKAAPFTQGGDTGNVVVRASFWSRNGLFYYFMRAEPFASSAAPGLRTDIVGILAPNAQLFDVTGSEFSGGGAPSIRPANSWAVYDWFPRTSPAADETLYIVAGVNTGNASSFTDDQIFAFQPEIGGPATQVTAFAGTGSSTSSVQRIRDLVVSPDGNYLAYSRGLGTSNSNAEDLFVIPAAGGASTQLSLTPSSGGQGIRRGSIVFTTYPTIGVAWVEGTNSRALPTANAAAFWNAIQGKGAPLLISTDRKTRQLAILGWSPINP